MKKRWEVSLTYRGIQQTDREYNVVRRKVYAGTAMRALIDVIAQEGIPTDIRDMLVEYKGEVNA